MWERGTKVECIAAFAFHPAVRRPNVGGHYTVRGAVDLNGDVGVWLEEITNPISPESGLETAFAWKGFRPLSSTGMTILRGLLAPQPHERETVDA